MSLSGRIAALIHTQGPISVAQFMAIALLDSKDGYYATRDPFGPGDKGGDFITAPEISQMFGEILASWLIQAWIDQGSPAQPRLVELGPGRGTLMADMLRVIRLVPALHDQLEVVLVEASPTLRQVQKETLSDMGIPIHWQNQFGTGLDERPLLLVANEFFDALPLRQFVKTPQGWCERMVTAQGESLSFALAPAPLPPAALPGDPLAELGEAPDGGVYEVSPPALALTQDIGEIIARQGGAALLVDYGYQRRGGFGETLQAVGAHHFADPLARPGHNDLSAHVDFSALDQAGRKGGARALGPVTQGTFLTALGIRERAHRLATANPGTADSHQAAVQRLTGADQMGALFKVLALVPPYMEAAPGFTLPLPPADAIAEPPA